MSPKPRLPTVPHACQSQFPAQVFVEAASAAGTAVGWANDEALVDVDSPAVMLVIADEVPADVTVADDPDAPEVTTVNAVSLAATVNTVVLVAGTRLPLITPVPTTALVMSTTSVAVAIIDLSESDWDCNRLEQLPTVSMTSKGGLTGPVLAALSYDCRSRVNHG